MTPSTSNRVPARPPASLMPGGHDPYILTSELAQYCLPAANRDPDRPLAYTNSICALFIAIGLIALRPVEPVARTVAPWEDPNFELIEAPPLPLQTLTLETQETPPESTEQPTDLTPVLAAPDAAAPLFPMPTPGLPIAPDLIKASGTFGRPLPPRPEVSTRKPERILPTDARGDFPTPAYPPQALMNKMMGTVVLLIRVDASGAISDITVKTSSGHALLDRETVKHVRSRWLFHPGEGERLYEAPIDYQM